MSVDKNLSQIGYDFSIVLNDNELNLLKSDSNIFKKIFNDSYFDINIISLIKHDKDFDNEINQIKTLHYHLAVRFNKKFMVKSIINHISDLFHINVNQISVNKLTSLESYTRYLIHLDNADKYHYLPFDIITNNEKYVNDCLSKLVITDERCCLSYVRKFHYIYEDIIINVCNWKKYNSLIKDFIRMR